VTGRSTPIGVSMLGNRHQLVEIEAIGRPGSDRTV
jgi:hypothetical protein